MKEYVEDNDETWKCQAVSNHEQLTRGRDLAGAVNQLSVHAFGVCLFPEDGDVVVGRTGSNPW